MSKWTKEQNILLEALQEENTGSAPILDIWALAHERLTTFNPNDEEFDAMYESMSPHDELEVVRYFIENYEIDEDWVRKDEEYE